MYTGALRATIAKKNTYILAPRHAFGHVASCVAYPLHPCLVGVCPPLQRPGHPQRLMPEGGGEAVSLLHAVSVIEKVGGSVVTVPSQVLAGHVGFALLGVLIKATGIQLLPADLLKVRLEGYRAKPELPASYKETETSVRLHSRCSRQNSLQTILQVEVAA